MWKKNKNKDDDNNNEKSKVNNNHNFITNFFPIIKRKKTRTNIIKIFQELFEYKYIFLKRKKWRKLKYSMEIFFSFYSDNFSRSSSLNPSILRNKYIKPLVINEEKSTIRNPIITNITDII